MPTFVVTGVAFTGVFKEIEAATEDEAREKAELLGSPHLCHHCTSAGSGSKGSWELSDGIGETVELNEKEE